MALKKLFILKEEMVDVNPGEGFDDSGPTVNSGEERPEVYRQLPLSYTEVISLRSALSFALDDLNSRPQGGDVNAMAYIEDLINVKNKLSNPM